MSRLALYRKWRPMTFRDVVEQRHVVDTLKNSLKADAIGHAYLFCGTRGTGKTTMAKIFSRAINCLDPQDGDPCNKCAICRGIIDGSILDVIEMDAASNNSVDNIRDIRDEVVYAPAIARYKVYIIDEVHMLSSGAFNALLKTLEEPPEHVVFILATTEPQKLPATVLSRCQRFDFKRITEAGIARRLGEIADDCGISVAPDALAFLARLSGGAMRDAISLLDQLTTLGQANVTLADVNEMAGFASGARIRALAGALLAGDIAGSWLQLDALMREGRDLSQLCVQLLGWFRNALLLQMGGESSPLMDLHPDDMMDARAAADALSGAELADWLRELSEYELRLRRTDNPRIMMEVLLLRLCVRSSEKAGAPSRMPVAQDSGNKPGAATLSPVRDTALTSDPRQMEERIGSLERQLLEFRRALAASGAGQSPHLPEFSPVNSGAGQSPHIPEFSPVNSGAAQSPHLPEFSPVNSGAAQSPHLPVSSPASSGISAAEGLSSGVSSSGVNASDSRAKGAAAIGVAAADAAVRSSAAGPLQGPIASEKAKGRTEDTAGASTFAPWARVIDEIRKSGSSKSGSMKLYAYILDTECLQAGTGQLRVIVSAEDVLKKKVLSQPDSIGMIESAARKVTSVDWQVRILDAREALTLKSGPALVNSRKQCAGTEESPASGTGDAELDRLLVFGLEKGIPITVRNE